jgi:hypothetical protein
MDLKVRHKFALAFAAKVADIALARAGLHTSSPLNGTSAVHLLTGLAMYYHYRDEIAAADNPKSVDEKCAHEFGADYEKTERWQALKAGLASPTQQEAELLQDEADQS